MTEQPLLPPPGEAPETSVEAAKFESPKPEAPRARRGDAVPWLYGLGFLVLAAGLVYVWQNPKTPDEPAAATTTALQAVEQRLADIDGRMTRLEQRPAPDLGKLTARLDALDGRIVDQSQLATRVDVISGRIESLSGRSQTGLDATKQQMDTTKQQIDGLANRIAAVEANAGNLDILSKRLNRIARLQEASFALAAGRPIGDLPDAPEALARYAHAAPPTEAQLRLRFMRDEQAALAAKQPDEGDAPFVNRVWDKAQGLITIRRGEDVVVGNPTATILGRAQAALEAGDIVDAVKTIEALKGPPAQAMANWLSDAKALLGARSALADMADQA